MANHFSLLLVLAFVLVVTAEDCTVDLKGLIRECKPYVMFPASPKITPSSACCSVVQKVNAPCISSKVTKEIEKVVCMDKVVYVADYCKNPLKPGSDCGSKCYILSHVLCTPNTCHELCMTCFCFVIFSQVTMSHLKADRWMFRIW